MELPLHELASEIADDRLIVVAGAGISIAHPSCVPLFYPLRDAMRSALRTATASMVPDKLGAEIARLRVAPR
jgi:hypothetical protein